MGFVPAEAPRLAILVVVDEPYGAHYGSVVAAPVFRDLAEEALKYMGVPPRVEDMIAKKTDEPPPRPRKLPTFEVALAQDASGDTAVPDFTGMSIGEAVTAARHAHLEIEVRGSGRAVAQEPGPGAAPSGAVCRVEFQPPS
jgi:cell division protein FtsI (penicillin-binding protein 3)